MTEDKSTEYADETLYCPWCGKKIPVDSLYCEYCGGYVPDDPESPEDRAEGGAEEGPQELHQESDTEESGVQAEAVIPETSAHGNKKWLYIGTAALIVVAAFFFMSGSRSSTDQAQFYYIKDNGIYGLTTGGQAEELQEVTTRYLEKWGSRASGGLLKDKADEAASGRTVPVRSSLGRYLFFPERGEKGSFDLVRTDLKKTETRTLDSNVTEFLAAGEGMAVYKKENGSLFCYDGTRKTKISSQVISYSLDQSGERLLWETEEDGTTDIYLTPFTGNGKEIRLERNAGLLSASDDFSSFLIQKEDTVYKVSEDGKKQQLSEGAEQVLAADAEKSSFYFTTMDGSGADTYTELYYYSDGKKTLLEDELNEVVWQGDGIVLYSRKGEEENSVLVNGKKTADLGMQVAKTEQAVQDSGKLYFLSPDGGDEATGKPEYELCSVSLTEEDFGRLETIDTGVSEIACIENGSACYFKDQKEGTGDLYCDGERVAYDVASGSVSGSMSGEGFLCIADVGSEGQRGTLLLTGGEEEVLADDVTAYSAVSDDEIYILTEYNRKKGRGNLYLYQGKEAVLSQTDIWGFFETGASGRCR